VHLGFSVSFSRQKKKAVTFVLWMVVVADLLPATFGLRSGFLLQVGSIVCN
jgi:hypothetical protein